MDFFIKVKPDIGTLLPVLENIFDVLLTDISENMTSLFFDHILDVQELLKASICKGITFLHHKGATFDSHLDYLYTKVTSLTNRVKIKALKLFFYDCITYDGSVMFMPEMAYVCGNESIKPVKEIYEIMIKEKDHLGVILLALNNGDIFSIFNDDITKAVFFNQCGILFETEVKNLKVLQKKDLCYLWFQGMNHSIYIKLLIPIFIT
jgi:hypothetical protein